MALLTILDPHKTLHVYDDIVTYLAGIGIHYERWNTGGVISENLSAEEVLGSYKVEIEALKAEGGYVTADVIDVNHTTPNLEDMLDKFRKEHWHDEDEVRFIVSGSGVFCINPKEGPVVSIEVAVGDLIRVPRGTLHWFDLCKERRIRAIRLFQDSSGWTPRYSNSRLEDSYLPVCLGQSDVLGEK